MAIFIALIFQVLFVLFAMIINVGMIVHDKINLQNSVDIAAYYAAQRQAEILNQIAHSNYQIRQAWKLLTWRIRVIADMGNKFHPIKIGINNPAEGPLTGAPFPSVCVNFAFWEGQTHQNLCSTKDIYIPNITSFPVVAPFGVHNILMAQAIKNFQSQIATMCEQAGPRNYEMAVRWMAAYRMQVKKSKHQIRVLADSLSASRTDFKDINGYSVLEGVKNTLFNNLTRANRDTLGSNFKMLNSMGEYDRRLWLPELVIYPNFFYTDFINSGGCSGIGKMLSNTQSAYCNANNCPEWMAAYKAEPNNPEDEYHSTIGVEKNPWFMAYVGVKAVTTPTKPFLPFGKPITLRARAYAQPFGGRIGPWLYKNWQPDAKNSFGTFPQDRVDALVPEPMDPNNLPPSNSPLNNLMVPNYSRFPGDPLGLKSTLALSIMKKSFLQQTVGQGKRILLSYYANVPDPTGVDNLAQTSRPQDPGENLQLLGQSNQPWLREFEVAAMAPDLFDITYYSIDAHFANDYFSNKNMAISEGNFDWGAVAQQPYNTDISTHIKVANGITDPTLAFYMVNDKSQLLTSWLPSGANQYYPENGFPPNFGTCLGETQAPVPGGCAGGGRTGYSVRLVSLNYLNSSKHKVGGENAPPAKIRNPPEDF